MESFNNSTIENITTSSISPRQEYQPELNQPLVTLIVISLFVFFFLLMHIVAYLGDKTNEFIQNHNLSLQRRHSQSLSDLQDLETVIDMNNNAI